MKWRAKKVRAERYAQVLKRMENKVDLRLRCWANWLQLRSDRLSLRWKYILFMVFCIGASGICALIIVNALK